MRQNKGMVKMNYIKLLLIVPVIMMLDACAGHTAYKTRIVCSPGSYPHHTNEQKAQLVKELLPINDPHSMIITYVGEYITIQKQIDECNKLTSTNSK